MIQAPAASADRILRNPEVQARTGLSRATLWRRIRAGEFPAPLQLGPNAVGWRESDIAAWLNARPVVNYAGGRSAA